MSRESESWKLTGIIPLPRPTPSQRGLSALQSLAPQGIGVTVPLEGWSGGFHARWLIRHAGHTHTCQNATASLEKPHFFCALSAPITNLQPLCSLSEAGQKFNDYPGSFRRGRRWELSSFVGDTLFTRRLWVHLAMATGIRHCDATTSIAVEKPGCLQQQSFIRELMIP